MSEEKKSPLTSTQALIHEIIDTHQKDGIILVSDLLKAYFPSKPPNNPNKGKIIIRSESPVENTFQVLPSFLITPYSSWNPFIYCPNEKGSYYRKMKSKKEGLNLIESSYSNLGYITSFGKKYLFNPGLKNQESHFYLVKEDEKDLKLVLTLEGNHELLLVKDDCFVTRNLSSSQLEISRNGVCIDYIDFQNEEKVQVVDEVYLVVFSADKFKRLKIEDDTIIGTLVTFEKLPQVEKVELLHDFLMLSSEEMVVFLTKKLVFYQFNHKEVEFKIGNAIQTYHNTGYLHKVNSDCFMIDNQQELTLYSRRSKNWNLICSHHENWELKQVIHISVIAHCYKFVLLPLQDKKR